MGNSVQFDPAIPTILMGAVKETFNVQVNCPLEILSAKAVDPEPSHDADITAAIGLKSSKFVGTLALCFPKATFLGVVNQMLGENHVEITRENSDAASELLNIIYGTARVKLNQEGHDFQPAIPTVAKGKEIQISHGNTPKIVRIECNCPCGPLFLEVSLRHA